MCIFLSECSFSVCKQVGTSDPSDQRTAANQSEQKQTQQNNTKIILTFFMGYRGIFESENFIISIAVT